MNFRNKNKLFTLTFIVVAVIICFLPWAPSLFDQLKIIRSGHYYFHEKPNLAHFIGDAASINSVRFFQLESFRAKMIIVSVFTGFVTVISAWGVYHFLKDTRNRVFVFAFVMHLIICFGLETIVNITSLQKIKMLFFIIPVLLIFLAKGFCHLPRRFHITTIALLFFCSILLANSVAAGFIKPRLTGPYKYLEILPPQINNHLKKNQQGLLIINTDAPKQLLAFVNAISTPVDIEILKPPFTLEKMTEPKNVGRYDFVFLANLYVPWQNNSMSSADIEAITQRLNKDDFNLLYYLDSGYLIHPRSLFIFKKSP